MYLSHSAQLDSGRRMVPGNQGAFDEALNDFLNNLSAREANIALLKLQPQMVTIARENKMSQEGIDFLKSRHIITGAKNQTFPVVIKELDGTLSRSSLPMQTRNREKA
jgi:hypothetical protein